MTQTIELHKKDFFLHSGGAVLNVTPTQKIALAAVGSEIPLSARAVLQTIQQEVPKPVERLSQLVTPTRKSARSLFHRRSLSDAWQDLDVPEKKFSSKKLLYHLLGDTLGHTKADLEGYSQLAAWKDMVELLGCVSCLGDAQFCSLIEEQRMLLRAGIDFAQTLMGAKTFEDFLQASKVLKKIFENLKEGTSFIFPGGWVGAGKRGHAIVYEFSKSDPVGTCSCAIHNTGGGIQYHSTTTIDDSIRKVAPLVISNIDMQKVFSPTFLMCLHELLSLPELFAQDWTEDHIYKALFPELLGEVREDIQKYVDVQRAGTCSFSSLRAYLEIKLSKKNFSRMYLGICLKALASHVNDASHIEDFNLILKCLDHYSHFLLYALSREHLSFQEFISIEKKTSSIRDSCEGAMRKLYHFRPPAITVPPEPWRYNLYFPTMEENILPFFLFPPFSLRTPSEICSAINTVDTLAANAKKGILRDEIQYEIICFFRNLRNVLEQSPCFNVPLQEREKAILSLCSIAQTYAYFFLTGINTLLHPQKMVPIFDVIACIKIIGREIPEIGTYPTHFPVFISEHLQDFYLSFETFSDEKKFLAPLQVEKSFGKFLFSSKETRGAEFSTSTGAEEFLSPYDDFGNFARNFRKKVPELLQNPKFTEQIGNCGQEQLPMFLFFDDFLGSFSPAFLPFRKLVDLLPALLPHQSNLGLKRSVRWEAKKDSYETIIASKKIVTDDGMVLDFPKKIKKFQPRNAPFYPKKNVLVFDRKRTKAEELFRRWDDEELMYQPILINSEGTLPELRFRERSEQIGIRPPGETEGFEQFKFLQKYIRLVTTEEELQIDTALALFSSNTALLSFEEPRLFLERALFFYSTLRKTEEVTVQKISKMAHIPSIIAAFLTSQLSFALRKNNVDTALFIFRLQRLFLERTRSSSLTVKSFLETFLLLRPLAAKNRLHTALLHYERAKLLQSLPFSEQLDDLIESSFLSNRILSTLPHPLCYEAGVLTHELLTRDDVRARLSQLPTAILNLVTENVAKATTWAMKKNFTFQSDTGYVFYPSSGIVTELVHQKAIVPTPPLLASCPQLQRCLQGNIPPYMCDEGVNGYSFIQNGTPFRVRSEGGVIFKCIEEVWYEHLPAHRGGAFDGNIVWASSKNLRVEHQKGHALFIIGSEARVCDASGKETSTLLLFEQDWERYKDLVPFRLFEENSYILPFSENGKTISLLHFPRIGSPFLSFFYDAEIRSFRNCRNRNEVVCKDQYLLELRACHHKLVIKDETTKKLKILIPGHRLNTKMGQSACSTDFNLNAPSYSPENLKPLPLYVYRKEKKTLVAESVEASLYLAYMYLWAQQYEDAFSELNKISFLPLSEEALSILRWIVETPKHDHDVRSLTIRLKATALLKAQNLLFNKPFSIEKKLLDKLFGKYTPWYHLSRSIFLSKEESFLLGLSSAMPSLSIKQIPPALSREIQLQDYKDYYGISSEEATPLLPRLTEDRFRVFLKALEHGIDRADSLSPSLIFDTFGVLLSTDRIKEGLLSLLSIAARSPSCAQMFAATLYAVAVNPDKFTPLDASQNIAAILHEAKRFYQSSATSASRPLSLDFLPRPNLAKPDEIDIPLQKDFFDPGKEPLKMPGHFTPLDTSSSAMQFASTVAKLVADPSPIAQKTCADVIEAVRQYEKERGSDNILSTTPQEIDGLLELLKRRATEEKHSAKKNRRKVLFFLEKKSSEPVQDAIQAIIRKTKLASSVGLKNAIYALAKPFSSGIFALNPALSLEEALSLREIIIEYLIHKTCRKNIQRAYIAALDVRRSMDTPRGVSQESLVELNALLSIKRNYDPSKHPEYLIFEEAFGSFLRPQQVKNLELFLENGAPGRVVEMIMAEGKTSVLLPLLNFLIGRKGNLAITILPESLFPSQAPEITQTLNDSFSKKVFSWELPVSTQISLESLSAIERGVQAASRNGHVIILKPKDFTGLFLQFLIAIKEPYSTESEQKLSLFQSIFSLFQEKGELLTDEVDSVWDVLKEHIMTTAELVPVNRIALDVTTTLFTLLLSEKNQPRTKEEFVERTAPSLIEAFIEHLSLLPETCLEVQSNKEAILKYLSNKAQDESLLALSPLLRDILAVARAEIEDVLPGTYTKTLKVHYGSPEGLNPFVHAIPYELGEPLRGSRFGHELEEVNYTIQLFLGASTNDLEAYLLPMFQNLHEKVQQELVEDPLEAAPSFIPYALMFGEDIIPFIQTHTPKENAKKIALLLDPKRKIAFARQHILPELKRTATSVQATSQIYALLVHIARGFTGTLWNDATFPTSIESVPSIETVGKTMHIFASDEILCGDASFDALQPNCSLIDVGGVFRDLSGLEMARKMLSINSPEIEGVIFYNQERIPHVLEREKAPYPLKECTLPPRKLLAFWAQQFTTGTNIRLGREAKALITISKDSIFRDLLQAVWRMRGLGKGQKIIPIISKETYAIICKTLSLPPSQVLTLKHIVAYTLTQQIERKASDNLRGAKQKAFAILQKGCIKALLKESPNKLGEIIAECESLFFQGNKESLFDVYGPRMQQKEASTALFEVTEAIRQSSSYQFLLKRGFLTPSEVEKELAIIQSMKNMLPHKVLEVHSGSMVQVQTQVQTQTMRATQDIFSPFSWNVSLDPYLDFCMKKKIVPIATKDKILSRRGWDDYSFRKGFNHLDKDFSYAPFFPMSAVLELSNETKLFASLFPAITTSVNLHSVPHSDFHPLACHNQPFAYMLVVDPKIASTKVASYILLNQHDACFWLKRAPLQLGTLVNVHSGTMFPDTPSLSHNFDLLIARVQAKVLAGNLSLSHQERLALLAWGSQIGADGLKKIQECVDSYILAVYPGISKAIVDSICMDKGKRTVESALRALECPQKTVQDPPYTAAFLKDLFEKGNKTFRTNEKSCTIM